jgi:RNA polymerase sigma factor (sigma-70 family)
MTSRPAVVRRSIHVGLPPFQVFLDEHREDVYRFLVVAAGPAEADDCFQETFLAALRAYPRLRDGSNLRGWVMTIAYRKAMDAHRARKRRADPVAEVPERPAAAAADPDPQLWDAVGALPAGQRGAVLLRYVADLPYAQIAATLGCREDAARQRVRDGLRGLKERVG